MKKCIYVYLVFCCMLLCPGGSRETAEEADTLVVALGPKTGVEAILSHPVAFVYPDIENKTRKILNRPSEEVITKADLLTITEFIMPDASVARPFLDLQWYRNLERVSLYRCGVKSLEGVEKLEQLTDLNLRGNQITDITLLYNLNKLTSLNLWENEIPEEELALFYEEKRGENFTVTQKGRLREDMAEFTFELTASYNLRVEFYEVQSIDVYENDILLQTISIPELTLFGQTETFDSKLDTLGFELEDVNFDGYLDIRLFDNLNGNYREEWVYLIWDPEKQQFEHDPRLNEISLASFDQEEQLIYGMERGSGSSHYFSTYEYRDGEIVEIRYEAEEWLYLPNEQIKQYFDASSVETEEEEFEAFYERIMEINEETGQLETVSEEYIFWGVHTWEEKLYIDASSELGKQIAEDRMNHF